MAHPDSSGKDRVQRSWRLVFLAVAFLATGCSKTLEADLFISLQYDGVPPGTSLVGDPPKGIEVRIKGPESSIKLLQENPLRYTVNLAETRLGVQSLPIDPDRIPLPGGVSVLGFNPKILNLELVRGVRKALRVTVSLLGEPAPECTVKGTDPKPSSIIVQGPEKILAALNSVATKPVDVTGAASSFQKEVALEIPEGTTLDGTQVVTARIDIGEKIVVRNLRGLVVVGKGTSHRYRITPASIDIQLKGPVRRLNALEQQGGIEVYMDLSRLKPGVYPRRAALKLPPEVTLLASRPEIFTVTLFKKSQNRNGAHNEKKSK